MRSKILAKLNGLGGCTSGNATMLVALSMPMLIGGGGLAVDTAQWYMWKREMQYAVDQAAIAGAWSKVSGSTGTEYQTRAQQELDANLQTVDFQEDANISLANYEGGTANSVLVTLAASKELPFSSMILSAAPTINVSARATFEKGRTFTSCLIAVDPDTKGAITVEGNAYIVANCGAAALSTDPDAIVNNGSPTFNVGYIVSGGGVDGDLETGEMKDGTTYTNEIFENQKGLVDPFKSLTPPASNGTTQSLTCIPATTTYTAAYNDTVTVVKKTYTGTNINSLSLTTTQTLTTATTPKTMGATKQTKVGDKVVDGTNTVTGTPTSQTTSTTGKNGKVTTTTTYTRIDTVTTEVGTVTAVTQTTTGGGAHALPGTYSTFVVSCDTTMDKGVYVIDGGLLKVNATDKLIGQGVMFVLKNGAGLAINGGATLDLRAMTTTEMVAVGIPEADALKLKDMLIFEDRNSPGNDGSSVNGTAGAILDGTIYLPNSELTFNGTFGAVKRCLVVTAQKLKIGGTTNMTTFCPPGIINSVSIGGGVTSVRLVA